MIVKVLSVLTIFLLSGCVTVPLVLTGLSVGSVAVSEATGKSVSDHTVSAATGQDCRIGRIFRDQSMCQDPNQINIQITTTGVIPSSIADIEARYQQQ
jgi:starvation-inducible outer membrane lipoprotein